MEDLNNILKDVADSVEREAKAMKVLNHELEQISKALEKVLDQITKETN